MQAFALDPKLLGPCLRLGRLPQSHLLLMDNAALPWFVLVPETAEVELCDLPPAVHERLFDEVRGVSLFIRRRFDIDKLNVAANGNVVRQLHVHVVGRRFDDYCWPDVVFGTPAPSRWQAPDVERLVGELRAAPELDFEAARDG